MKRVESQARPAIQPVRELSGGTRPLNHRLILGIHLTYLQRWSRLLAARHHNLVALELVSLEEEGICDLFIMQLRPKHDLFLAPRVLPVVQLDIAVEEGSDVGTRLDVLEVRE